MLPGTDALVPPSAFPNDPAVMVTCDVASLDRLASLGGPAARATTLIWIDHHVTNEGLGTIPIIDPSASSTCELVWRLLKVLGRRDARSRPRCACTRGSSPTPGGSSTRRSGRTRSAWRRSSASSRSTTPGSCRRSTRTTGSRTSVCSASSLERVRVEPDADLVWTYLTRADLDEARPGTGRRRRPDRPGPHGARGGRRGRGQAAARRAVQGEPAFARRARRGGRGRALRGRGAPARLRLHLQPGTGGHGRVAQGRPRRRARGPALRPPSPR